MKIIFALLLMIFLLNFCSTNIKETEKIKIIPRPVAIEIQDGSFLLTPDTFINAGNDGELQSIRDYLVGEIRVFTGMKMKLRDSAKGSNRINLSLVKEMISKKEGYKLQVDQDTINITGKDYRGIFYGVISLIQLLPLKQEGKTANIIKIPRVKITDYPRFKWRGMMLDVCRHYFPPEFIKKFIDNLARHKMNTFHWHLTEDQGWRIEIRKYPGLTRISSYRDETLLGHNRDTPHKFDGIKHGGFYTQTEIKEIIKYARERYITVIPEIEMPGHSSAALAAYPELACSKGPFKVQTYWGVFEDVYCAGKESTFKFLTDVLSEIVELFPAGYIHIGGDECPKARWEECPACQQRIKKEKLKDEHELQSYFIKRIEKFLKSKGKKLIGWDEILEGGLAPDATVMSWRGVQGGIQAARAGHDVIMSPTSNCYFDYYQGKREYEPLAIGGYLSLKKVYDFDPLPGVLTKEEKKHILGAQANLWTEYIASEAKAEYMIFPRISAIAEVVWTPQPSRKWGNFTKRLKKQLKRYSILGLNFARSIYQVDIQSEKIKEKSALLITLNNEVQEGVIRYTTDKKDPDNDSKIYKEKIKISHSVQIRAGTFLEGKLVGKISRRDIILPEGIEK